MMTLLLWAVHAWARAGGGQQYGGSSPSHSGGGYSGGGFSGGGGGDVGGLILLVGGGGTSSFVFVALFILVVVLNNRNRANQGRGPTVLRQTPARPVELGGLKATDAAFSRALFLDFARLVFTRAYEEAGHLEVLGGLIEDSARGTLADFKPPIQDVIHGAVRLNQISQMGDRTHLRVFFEANLTERGVQKLTQQMWTFSRLKTATSPLPEALRALRCPQCGSALQTRTDGSCTNCGTSLDAAQFPWSVSSILVVDQRPVPTLSLTLGGGMEVGTDLPTLASPTLRQDLAALAGRHPDATWPQLQRRFVDVFQQIQKAWSEMKWSLARPHETDFLYQQHRYWMERYRKDGLQNKMADLAVTRVEPAKVELDLHVSVVVVRIFARCKDWTEDQAGKVVSGSRTEDRTFSEYWTFVRSASAKTGGDAAHCPSCGAPLDRVGESGVCGYCDTQVTTGEHGWVLSMIDQDEAWRG